MCFFNLFQRGFLCAAKAFYFKGGFMRAEGTGNAKRYTFFKKRFTSQTYACLPPSWRPQGWHSCPCASSRHRPS